MGNFMMAKMDGKNNYEFAELSRKTFWLTYALDWSFWPILMFLTFKKVPFNYHPTVVYGASVAWVGIQSFVYHTKNDNLNENENLRSENVVGIHKIILKENEFNIQ